MALIGSIRKHYWFLVLVIGISLLLFVLSDFSRRSNKQPTTVGEVVGEKISIMEFNKRVDENISLQKQNSNRENLTSAETYQIQQSTWQQLVNEIVMNSEYEKLGIIVTTEELTDMIRGEHIHPYIVQSFTDPKTGAFDKKNVIDFITHFDEASPDFQSRYLMLEKAIKQDRINQKYNSIIGKSFYVPTAFAKRSYEDASKTANVFIAGMQYKSINDTTVKITDDDYKKYYEANKYRYQQDKTTCNLVYISFPLEPSAEDIATTKDQVNKLYEEFKTLPSSEVASFVSANTDTKYDSSWHHRGDFQLVDSALFTAPVGEVLPPVTNGNLLQIFKVMDRQARSDSLKASHILISYAGSAAREATRTKEAAEKMADSILNVVKSNPAQFDLIASTLSDDQVAKERQGNLDWFPDGAMVEPFNSTIANGSVGEIKKVETMFGYHIVKITGKTAPKIKVKVANIDRRMEASSRTINAIFNTASSLAAENNTIEKLENAAKAKGFALRSADQLDAMASTIGGIGQTREVAHWAFNKNTEVGNVSNVFKTEEACVVAALKSRTEKGIIPLADVKEYIKPLVLREKKAEILIKRASEKIATITDVSAFLQQPTIKVDTVNVAFSGSNLPNHGYEPKIVGAIFGSKEGKVSKPQQGEQAVYVFVVDKFNTAPQTTDFDKQKRDMAMLFQSRVNSIPSVLEQKAHITDNRFMFY